jgi:hypothetical protein
MLQFGGRVRHEKWTLGGAAKMLLPCLEAGGSIPF